jgi:DNA-binding phage protein
MIDEQIAEIRDFLTSSGVNKNQLAKLSGLNRCVLHGITSPDWNPTVKTLRAICNAIRAYRLGVE